MTSATMKLNNELNGIELYFEDKPATDVLENLKSNGFRWSKFKKCWYTKQSEKAFRIVENITNNTTETVAPTEKKTTLKSPSKAQKLSLWDRVQFVEGSTDKSKYHYNFVGSNYSGLSVKDTAVIIRKHLKQQFSEVKFSVTSNHSKIDITIKESPYNNLKLEYDYNRSSQEYRDYEAKNNKEILSIKEYCQKLLDSYNFDNSDSMTDYFHCHYYDSVSVDYDYIQTEQTEEIKKDIEDFRSKLNVAAQEEKERQEKEYNERLAQMEIENQKAQEQHQKRSEQKENIYNSIKAVALEEKEQYFVIGSEFAKLNKNNTLAEYKEEVESGKYTLENVKITKELHFNSLESLDYFSNMLMYDFDFLANEGGSYTNDYRVNSMTDYYNMTEEERNTVNWNTCGVAIYYNNKLQYIANPEGHSYARYIGLVENAKIVKSDPVKQLVNNAEIEQLKDITMSIEDHSVEVITDNNLVGTWNNENWSIYKELLKNKLKNNNIRLTKSIIQQLTEESEELKIAMYKILTEVDGIQEQFKTADLQQGDKVTLFSFGSMGGMVTQHITVDNIEPTTYAQYNNAIKLTFTPKGKRTKYYNHFYGKLLVYKGWIDLPTEVLNTVENKSNFIITSSKYLSCDSNQFDEILEHFNNEGMKPIINTYKPQF